MTLERTGDNEKQRIFGHKCLVVSFQNLSKEQADYCIARMKPYEDPKTGRSVPDAYDYVTFTHDLFIN